MKYEHQAAWQEKSTSTSLICVKDWKKATMLPFVTHFFLFMYLYAPASGDAGVRHAWSDITYVLIPEIVIVFPYICSH